MNIKKKSEKKLQLILLISLIIFSVYSQNLQMPNIFQNSPFANFNPFSNFNANQQTGGNPQGTNFGGFNQGSTLGGGSMPFSQQTQT
jgi:hypothetical protein